MLDKAPLSSHPVKLLNLALLFRLRSWMWNNVRPQTSSLRQYFPKEMDSREVEQADLDRLQAKINRKPREN